MSIEIYLSVMRRCPKISLMKEMRVPPVKEPRLYMKATSSYISQGQKIELPNSPNTPSSVWYEVELGVVIGEPVKNANPKEVLAAIGGYCTAMDLTDKNRLLYARKTGQSWALAKSFDTACPVGELIPKDRISRLDRVELWLRVNGILRQSGRSDDMIFPVLDLVSYISHRMTLERGDMILTGTPAGIGICERGDTIEAGIGNLDKITFHVGKH